MLEIAVLNKMLPKGYKFEQVENLYKHQLASQQNKKEQQKESGASSEKSLQEKVDYSKLLVTRSTRPTGQQDNQSLSCYPYSFVSTQLRSETDSSEADLNWLSRLHADQQLDIYFLPQELLMPAWLLK